MSEKLRKHLKQLSRKPLTENEKKHITSQKTAQRRFMAESIGIEPTHRFHDDGLAIRCITTLPTLH